LQRELSLWLVASLVLTQTHKMLKKISIVSLTSLAFPLSVFAQPDPTVIDTPSGVVKLLNDLGDWAYGILLGLAVIFIVVAGYMYLFSGGDTEKTEKAKKTIVYAVIAVAVAILAKGIIALLQNVLTN